MIYLGNQAIGLLASMPKWFKINTININEDIVFDTFTQFVNSNLLNTIISQLSSGDYRIVFVNNTNNTRAGQWITFTKNNAGEFQQISVLRIGAANPLPGAVYGVNVYSGSSIELYESTMN